ncbi:MAG: hypothetical protein WC010_00455 [Candidatus Absconditabacterales bacterium]
MLNFIKPFLLFVVIYHIFVTIVGYGILGGAYPQLPALGRDVIWLLFFIVICMANFKALKSYLKIRKRPRITLIILISFGVGISLLKGKGTYDIFIGIKYGLLYLLIFLSSTFIGRLFTEKSTNNFLKFLKYFLITTLITGFLRQGFKFIRPDFFLNIGYGPLNDFKFGVKPPIYYLTGYQGTPRRQGIFSGPNNYGYFLIAFLPVIFFFLKQKFTSIKKIFTTNKAAIINTSIIVLWILAIVLTLSRTAFIGGIVGLAIMNIQRIKKHKKISLGIGIVFLTGLVGLSIFKGASTLGHLKAKFGSLKYVIDQPSGYGLGTSGPAVNHNGTILPENYYIQLMLDIGTLGFIMWTLVILQIIQLARKIQTSFKTLRANTSNQTIYLIRRGLNIGRVCLLIMGLFLHVFEDSMINYLFFVSWGILSGYLSTMIDKRLPKGS